MFKKYRFLPLAAALFLICSIALPAMAQTQQQGNVGSQSQVSDAELEKAAEAYAEITSIRRALQQSLQQAQDQDERQKLQAAADQKMVQAVEDTGLDVQTYISIMEQVRTDEELLKKFQKLEQKAKSS